MRRTISDLGVSLAMRAIPLALALAWTLAATAALAPPSVDACHMPPPPPLDKLVCDHGCGPASSSPGCHPLFDVNRPLLP